MELVGRIQIRYFQESEIDILCLPKHHPNGPDFGARLLS